MGYTRAHLIVLLSFSTVFLMGTHVYFQGDEIDSKHICTNDLTETLLQLVDQRNNLSRALNLKQQKIGQMECEEKKRSKGKQVASTGGWCAVTSVENSGQHKTDTHLASALADFFKDKYVASFGDGPGRYKQLFLETGLLKDYDAYDGAPFSERTSEGRVRYLDLTLPQYGLPLYDWVMSLEVAEHIPKEYESIYLDNIVRHAKEGVVISWAVPAYALDMIPSYNSNMKDDANHALNQLLSGVLMQGQAGYSHVNNKPFEYVKNLFERFGFEHDKGNSTKLQGSAKFKWLKRNINVYRRKVLGSEFSYYTLERFNKMHKGTLAKMLSNELNQKHGM